MTLIFGAIHHKLAVICADGSETTHTPGQPSQILTRNRQKLLPIPSKPMVIAISGQSQLRSRLDCAGRQYHLISRIDKMAAQLSTCKTIIEVAESIFASINDDVVYTMNRNYSAGIHASALVIDVIGWGAADTNPCAYTATWPMINESNIPGVTHHNCKLPFLIHTGIGLAQLRRVLDDKSQPYKTRLTSKSNRFQIQKDIRSTYEAALKFVTDQCEFGGDYQEITIQQSCAEWTRRPQGGFAQALEYATQQ